MSNNYQYGQNSGNLKGVYGSTINGTITDASGPSNRLEIDFCEYIKMRPKNSISRFPVWIAMPNKRVPTSAELKKLSSLKMRIIDETKKSSEISLAKQKQNDAFNKARTDAAIQARKDLISSNQMQYTF